MPIPALSRAAAAHEVRRLLGNASEPRHVALVGPAGIGKSHLLEELASEIGGRRVSVVGVEEESAVAWSGVEQLARALRPVLGRLPDVHAAQLEPLIGGTHRASTTPVEPISVASAVHHLVCAAAQDEPIVITVDDAHWLDADSRAALRFVARRLLGEPVTVVLTSRTDDAVVGTRRVHLGELDASESAAMLRSLGVEAPVAAAITRDAGGNPLLLVHVVNRLTAEQRAGVSPLPSPLPVAGGLAATLAAQVADLPERTQRALLVVAAGTPLGPRWAEILRACGHEPTDLEPAESAGLLTLDARAVEFTHPLHRAAALGSGHAAELREAHRLLAAAVPDPDRAVVHRAGALIEPDDEVALALDELATRSARHGAPASAAELWQRAAEVAADETIGRRVRVRAARAALDAGSVAPARQLLESSAMLEGEPDPSVPIDLVELAAAYHLTHGDLQLGHRLSMRCAQSLLADGSPDAVHHLLEAARHRVRHSDVVGTMEIGRLLAGVSRDDLDPITRAKIDALAATGDRSSGNVDRLRDAVERALPGGTPAGADLAFLADVVALPLAFNRQYEDSQRLVDRLRAEAVRTNQPAVLPLLDTAIACARSRFDLPGCVAAASSAIEWADEINQPNLAVTALVYLVVGHSLLGNDAVFPAADRLRPHGQFGWITAEMSIGCYWLTTGRPEASLAALRPLHDWLGGELKSVQFWQADLGEAAVRAGDRGLAREVADQLADFDTQLPNAWLRGAHGRIEGLLADVDDCDRWFERSVEQFRLGRVTMAEARSQLLWGERLRRARRRAEARPHLEAARGLFAQVGASRWVERTDQELLAAGAGGRPDEARRSAEQLLTAHELRIARLAVDGGSYKSIAAELFLSPRTVETHLSAIYRKLGLRNRAELAAASQRDATLLAGAPDER
jgi:DNA-binding CsgD family transcriptional regulator